MNSIVVLKNIRKYVISKYTTDNLELPATKIEVQRKCESKLWGRIQKEAVMEPDGKLRWHGKLLKDAFLLAVRGSRNKLAEDVTRIFWGNEDSRIFGDLDEHMEMNNTVDANNDEGWQNAEDYVQNSMVDANNDEGWQNAEDYVQIDMVDETSLNQALPTVTADEPVVRKPMNPTPFDRMLTLRRGLQVLTLVDEIEDMTKVDNLMSEVERFEVQAFDIVKVR